VLEFLSRCVNLGHKSSANYKLQASTVRSGITGHQRVRAKVKKDKGSTLTFLAGMSLSSRHHDRSCHCIYSTLSAFRTALAYTCHNCMHIPRVSEAAAVVLDLALCSQNSPLSTPTIKNWHRSCVLRDWNLRVRTDLHHNSHLRLSDTHNTHVCKWSHPS